MGNLEFGAMQALVLSVLTKADAYEWSVQGFGMMRTYLDPHKRYRLNIWDSSLAVPDVSIIHDHPWDFHSWVISGAFRNQRYAVGRGEQYKCMIIEPGDQGGPRGEAETILLQKCGLETYGPGDEYSQRAYEVHASYYDDGTVTLNDRTNRGEDIARVCWLEGGWVDAKPRVATPAEIDLVVQRALFGAMQPIVEAGRLSMQNTSVWRFVATADGHPLHSQEILVSDPVLVTELQADYEQELAEQFPTAKNIKVTASKT